MNIKEGGTTMPYKHTYKIAYRLTQKGEELAKSGYEAYPDRK